MINVSFPLQASTLMPTLAETWMQKGEQKGMLKGTHDGRLAVITELLAHQFGEAISPDLQIQLEGLSADDLGKLTKDLRTITTSDQLRQWLAVH